MEMMSPTRIPKKEEPIWDQMHKGREGIRSYPVSQKADSLAVEED